MQRQIEYRFQVNPLYIYLKKHLCIDCGEKLEIRYNIEVNPDKRIAYFGSGQFCFTDGVEYRTPYFKCPKCSFQISIDEMKAREKGEHRKQ